MLITEDFVFIHFPKTGGTFVTKILEDLLPRLKKKIINQNKHGLCCEIPEEYQNLPIISCIRNPFDIKVSQFNYGWWKKLAPQEMIESIKKEYPSFPKLSFNEFVDSLDRHSPLIKKNVKVNEFMRSIGQYSQRFLHFYCQDIDKIIKLMNEEFIQKKRYKHYMYPVHFLRNHELNNDLYNYLLSLGYSERLMEPIKTQQRILPGRWRHFFSAKKRKKRDSWESYYTVDLRKKVRERERLLFGMFPEFNLSIKNVTT